MLEAKVLEVLWKDRQQKTKGKGKESAGIKCELWKLCKCLKATPSIFPNLRIFKKTFARNNVNFGMLEC